MLEVAGSPDGDDKIQQGISQGNINKHVNPMIKGSDQHQQDRGFGADDVDAHDPVYGCRSVDSPMQSEQHQETERNSYAEKKNIHLASLENPGQPVLHFSRQPCGSLAADGMYIKNVSLDPDGYGARGQGNGISQGNPGDVAV